MHAACSSDRFLFDVICMKGLGKEHKVTRGLPPALTERGMVQGAGNTAEDRPNRFVAAWSGNNKTNADPHLGLLSYRSRRTNTCGDDVCSSDLYTAA
jgi:hypothetical protein